MNLFYYTMKPSARTRNFHMNFFYFYFCIIAVMTSKYIQEYRNNTLNSSSMPLQCLSCRFYFHLLFFLFSIGFSVLSRDWGCSDLELSCLKLWNKQLQFSSCFQRPLPISFLSQLCSFLFQLRDQQPWFAGTTFRREENSIPLASWKSKNPLQAESLVKNEIGFQMSKW